MLGIRQIRTCRLFWDRFVSSISVTILQLGSGTRNEPTMAIATIMAKSTLTSTKLSLSLSNSWKAYLNSAIFYSDSCFYIIFCITVTLFYEICLNFYIEYVDVTNILLWVV